LGEERKSSECEKGLSQRELQMKTSAKGHDVIVIGTSSGGLEALSNLVAQLPKSLPAAIFVVQHMAPDAPAEILVERLDRASALHCALAREGQSFRDTAVILATRSRLPHFQLASSKKSRKPCGWLCACWKSAKAYSEEWHTRKATTPCRIRQRRELRKRKFILTVSEVC
jgi:chemotaxis response regulator CheB